jgi:hypothetical protein
MTQGRAIKLDKKLNLAFTLDPKAVKLIDQNRGKQSRSGFLNNLILETCDE